MLLLVIIKREELNIMGKVKSLLMDKEAEFNALANDLLTSSECEAEAVNTIVALAQDMGLLEYLGGYYEIESMVSEAWYDMNYEHIAV